MKDSAPRYYWASVAHGFKYFALASPILGIIYNFISGFFLSTPIEFLLFYLIWTQVQELNHDDDDNYWRRLGKRIKKKAKELASYGKLVPLPTPS